jgi:glycosyltransferase involved in cell wall biosynthesis
MGRALTADVIEAAAGRPCVDLSSASLRWRGHVHDVRDLMSHASRDTARELVSERRRRRIDRRDLAAARMGSDAVSVAEPLVTVRIATAGRLELLMQRALPSVLNQTYENLDILVVGDGCADDVGTAVNGIGDERIRYLNLPKHDGYPSRLVDRWLVAGSLPMNYGIEHAAGAWLAPCDDDDALTANHVEVLLTQAKRLNVEFVHSRTLLDLGDITAVIGRRKLTRGQVTHGSVLYSSRLRHFRYSTRSYLLGEPFDYNLWRRFAAAGVRMGYVDRVTYIYYPASFSLEKWRTLARRQLQAARPGNPR